MAKPLRTIKIGTVKVTIWPNYTADGRRYVNASVKNTYKKDGEWIESDSYGLPELCQLEKAITIAIEEMVKEVSKPKDDNHREEVFGDEEIEDDVIEDDKVFDDIPSGDIPF